MIRVWFVACLVVGGFSSSAVAGSPRVFVEDQISKAAEAALLIALERVQEVPEGAEITFRGRAVTDDNPQVLIRVDGRLIYHEYLIHSERNLSDARRSLADPRTWLSPRAPSDDLSKQFEAALLLAHGGVSWARKQPSQPEQRLLSP